jgi:AraC family transcriptional regulator of adaptative response/methylated-DNA-[protein]-cysteine methyltransferase
VILVTIEALTLEILSEEECFRALEERDTRFDGVFIAAVTSTGIYCRPSCPARKPLRKHVRFFPDTRAAREAGFRACKRCDPDEHEDEARLIEGVCRYIEDHSDEALTLAQLGQHAGMSASHLQRTFKKITGISPREYREAHRLERFKYRVKQGRSILDAIYEVGYGSSSRLYEKAPTGLGMTPATYQRGGDGASIYYTAAECYLGFLLVAATKRGICFISLGDEEFELEDALRAEFPAAEISRDEAYLGEWLAAVLEILDGEQPHEQLPLDIQATAFQRQVWSTLQAIPAGETRTYSEVAAAVGSPNGARAVARACATNPVPLVIPCHRVVRKDGDLGGYRWGLERKQLLLTHELR